MSTEAALGVDSCTRPLAGEHAADDAHRVLGQSLCRFCCFFCSALRTEVVVARPGDEAVDGQGTQTRGFSTSGAGGDASSRGWWPT
jgi:hypothetical protein